LVDDVIVFGYSIANVLIIASSQSAELLNSTLRICNVSRQGLMIYKFTQRFFKGCVDHL